MLSSILVSYFLHQVTLPSYREQVQLEQNQSMAEVGTGALTVTVREPTGGTLAPGAQRIEMLSLTFTASCEHDINLESFDVQRKGLGNRADIEAVYVMLEGRRLSEARTFASRDETATMRFRNVHIPACEGIELSILADIASDASPAGEHRMVLGSASRILSTAKRVSIVRSQEPQIRRTVGGTIGKITFLSLRVLRTVRYGANQVVARFQLSASNGDDHEITAITLTNNGSARNENLENLYLQSGRNRVTGIVSQLRSDQVRLIFDPPLLLTKNDTRLFELHADVRAGRSHTLEFTLAAPGDLEATPARRRR